MLTSRRDTVPYGAEGGHPGQNGHQVLIRHGEEIDLPACFSMDVHPGDRLRIETPGGGGFGSADGGA